MVHEVSGQWTYSSRLWLLTKHLLHQFVHFILRLGLCVGQYSLVNSSRVAHYGSDVISDVSNICERRRDVTAGDDIVVGEDEAFVQLAGRDSGQSDLVPPTNINYGVGEIDTLDVIKDCLFLR
jgi:hypothetical protein